MATPTEAQIAHQELVDQLDIHSIHKSFRNSNWRANQRRNKNIKTILGDASRKDVVQSSSVVMTPSQQEDGSQAASPTRSGNSGNNDGDDNNNNTNHNSALSTSGSATPTTLDSASGNNQQPNLAQASRSLSKLVLEKSLRPSGAASGSSTTATAAATTVATVGGSAPSATYTNIESAPSLAHTKRYCDLTGLPAPYIDPKSRLRYHNKEVFAFIRSFPQGVAEQYLEARGAHTVLK